MRTFVCMWVCVSVVREYVSMCRWCVCVRTFDCMHIRARERMSTGCRRCIGCLKLQDFFRKRAMNCRALLRKVTYKGKASYASLQPCTWHLYVCAHLCVWAHLCAWTHSRAREMSKLRRVAVCCSVLQRVAVCRSALQCIALSCSELHVMSSTAAVCPI